MKKDSKMTGKKRQRQTADTAAVKKAAPAAKKSRCPVSGRCGGCTMIDTPYQEQLQEKQALVEELIGGFGPVEPIIRMKNPDHYRTKVTSVFSRDRRGRDVAGIYRKGSHEVIPVTKCLLQDTRADRIIHTVFTMLSSYRIRPYSEEDGSGLLRYVQIRAARATRQIMVTLVVTDPVLPHAPAFIAELTGKHPEITTIVMNINDKDTTMVLGQREKVLFGPGYIEDELCGKRFRISSRSFYQVNSLQTEKLYNIALDLAGFSGKERILDAYCGIGTIGIIASDRCRNVLCVELNPEAARDAAHNAQMNGASNVGVYEEDAGRFMRQLAEAGEKVDVVFLDPPRSGASEEFLSSLVTLAPAKAVYVSCDPWTLARDLGYLTENGYEVKKAVPVDMFPYTKGVETAVLLTYKGRS